MARLVDVPMAGTARESIRGARVTSTDTCGVSGDPKNFGVNEAGNVSAANRIDRDGYGTEGLNIATGRSKSTRFTGAR